MSEPRRHSKERATKTRETGPEDKSNPSPGVGREYPERKAMQEIFPGRGGTRRGFVAPNEIEDMSLFDEDPGKIGQEEPEISRPDIPEKAP